MFTLNIASDDPAEIAEILTWAAARLTDDPHHFASVVIPCPEITNEYGTFSKRVGSTTVFAPNDDCTLPGCGNYDGDCYLHSQHV